MEANHGDFSVACVADQDQGADAEDVQDPDAEECAGNEQEGLREAALFAEIPEPDGGEDEDKPETFKSRAGFSDDDGETRGADGEVGGVDLDAGEKDAEHDLYGVEGCDLKDAAGSCAGLIPEGLEREAEGPGESSSEDRIEPKPFGFADRADPDLERNASEGQERNPDQQNDTHEDVRCVREQQEAEAMEGGEVGEGDAEDASEMRGEEAGVEGKRLFLALEPGVAESDEDGVGNDAEWSDCAEQGGCVRDAGEEENVGCEQAAQKKQAAEKMLRQPESGTRLGVIAPSPGLVEVVDFDSPITDDAERAEL